MLHAGRCGGVDDPQLLGGNRRRDEDDAVDGSFDGRSIVKIAGYELHSGAFQRSKACAITDEDSCRDVNVAEQRGGFLPTLPAVVMRIIVVSWVVASCLAVSVGDVDRRCEPIVLRVELDRPWGSR